MITPEPTPPRRREPPPVSTRTTAGLTASTTPATGARIGIEQIPVVEGVGLQRASLGRLAGIQNERWLWVEHGKCRPYMGATMPIVRV